MMGLGTSDFQTSRILLVDDDPDFRAIVQNSLSKDLTVISVGSIHEANTLLTQDQFELILLDLTLPDGEGLKFFSRLRDEELLKNIPVIMLTGRADVDDKVIAFHLGAEDYIVKPVDLREIRARVLAKIRKKKAKSEEEQTLSLGDLKIVIPLQRLYIVKDRVPQQIEVTPIEFKLLHAFMKSKDRVFTRDELITLVWGPLVHILDRTVDSHISDLRKKIAESLSTIKCIRGVGYRFFKKSTPLE